MLKVLDTFAGAGGFSAGFVMAGCEVVGGIEMDSWASETFSLNHPKATVLARQIQEVGDDELDEVFGSQQPDVLLGGPPCQGYSICRKDSGDPSDPRNSLFMECFSPAWSSWRTSRISRRPAPIRAKRLSASSDAS
jgi:DNA (cytosine-5)-methyltransferase 1